MTTLIMPTAPGFRAARFGLRSRSQVFDSPLSGAVQTLELPGALWFASFELPPMTRAQAADWQAFLVALGGRAGRFRGFDADARSPRGAYDAGQDAPVVSGAGQTGATLATAGWRASVSGLLLPGDYVEVGGELKMVTAQLDSDASGAATLAFAPALRASPADAAPLTLIDPGVTMRLASDEDAVWAFDLNRIAHGFAFSGIEVF